MANYKLKRKIKSNFVILQREDYEIVAVAGQLLKARILNIENFKEYGYSPKRTNPFIFKLSRAGNFYVYTKTYGYKTKTNEKGESVTFAIPAQQWRSKWWN